MKSKWTSILTASILIATVSVFVYRTAPRHGASSLTPASDLRDAPATVVPTNPTSAPQPSEKAKLVSYICTPYSRDMTLVQSGQIKITFNDTPGFCSNGVATVDFQNNTSPIVFNKCSFGFGNLVQLASFPQAPGLPSSIPGVPPTTASGSVPANVMELDTTRDVVMGQANRGSVILVNHPGEGDLVYTGTNMISSPSSAALSCEKLP